MDERDLPHNLYSATLVSVSFTFAIDFDTTTGHAGR